MKRFLVMMAIIFMAIGARAQSTIQSEDGKYPVYCDLKAYNFWGVGKVKVMLDMGAVSNGGGSFESLYGEDGKQIKFNTVMAAATLLYNRLLMVIRRCNMQNSILLSDAQVRPAGISVEEGIKALKC